VTQQEQRQAQQIDLAIQAENRWTTERKAFLARQKRFLQNLTNVQVFGLDQCREYGNRESCRTFVALLDDEQRTELRALLDTDATILRDLDQLMRLEPPWRASGLTTQIELQNQFQPDILFSIRDVLDPLVSGR